MGARVGQICFTDIETARAFVYSQTPPALSGSSVTVLEFDGLQWNSNIYTAGVLSSSSPAPPLSLPSCDLSQDLADSALLGSLIVVAWASAWGVSVLRRAFFM